MGLSIEQQLSAALSAHTSKVNNLQGRNFDPLTPRGNPQKPKCGTVADDIEAGLKRAMTETTPQTPSPEKTTSTPCSSSFTGAHTDLHDALEEIIGNKLKARPFFRKHSYDFMQRLLEIAQEIHDEKKVEFEAAQAEAKKAQAVLDQVQKLAEQSGISLDDVLKFATGEAISKPAKRKYTRRQTEGDKPASPSAAAGTTRETQIKYKCHMFGRDYYWNGRGLPINTFKAYFSKGYSKEDCLLPEEEQFYASQRPDIDMSQDVPPQYEKQFRDALAKYTRENSRK